MNETHWLSQIKAVTLDWGNTLAHVVGKDQILYDIRLFHRILTVLQIHHSYDLCQKVILKLHQEYETNYNRKELDWRDANKTQLLAPLLEAYFSDHRNNFPQILEQFAQQNENLLPFFKNLEGVLQTFLDLGWQIGLLSHVNYEEKYVRQRFEEENLLHYFQFFSLSGDIGKTKPHSAHFENAQKQCGYHPHEILHIGDHPEKDILGAKLAGFKSALIYEPGNYPPEQFRLCQADLVLTSIFEIKEVIKAWQNNENLDVFSLSIQQKAHHLERNLHGRNNNRKYQTNIKR